MLQKILLSVFLFLSTLQLSGQNQVQPESYGQWLMYFGDNKISDKIGIHSELQLRNYFLDRTLHQTLSRIGINYYVDPRIMFTAGYGYIHTDPSSENILGSSQREHRIWEQMILRHKTKAVFMEHRYRLEQRFIHNKTENIDKFDNRIRYRFQTVFPFYTLTPQLKHFFFAAYNEIFVNLGRQVSGELFDRNRLYFAMGYQVSPKLNFQLGYLNEGVSLPGSQVIDFRHLLQVGVMYNMDDLMQTFFENKE